MFTSHENGPTTRRSFSGGRRWGVRIRWEEGTTFAVDDFLSCLIGGDILWQCAVDELCGIIRNDLIRIEYLCAHNCTLVGHHSDSHGSVTVCMADMSAKCHLAHQRSHGPDGSHSHHRVPHTHAPNST